jgi:hypothetical protein
MVKKIESGENRILSPVNQQKGNLGKMSGALWSHIINPGSL